MLKNTSPSTLYIFAKIFGFNSRTITQLACAAADGCDSGTAIAFSCQRQWVLDILNLLSINKETLNQFELSIKSK